MSIVIIVELSQIRVKNDALQCVQHHSLSKTTSYFFTWTQLVAQYTLLENHFVCLKIFALVDVFYWQIINDPCFLYTWKCKCVFTFQRKFFLLCKKNSYRYQCWEKICLPIFFCTNKLNWLIRNRVTSARHKSAPLLIVGCFRMYEK